MLLYRVVVAGVVLVIIVDVGVVVVAVGDRVVEVML